MAKLQPQDLVALSKADLKNNCLALDSKMVIDDPLTTGRLTKAKLVAKSGKLTEKGVVLVKQVLAIEEKLKAGVDFEMRRDPNPKALLKEELINWKTGSVSKQPVVTNGELLYVGTPLKVMNAEKGAPQLRQRIPIAIKDALKGDFVELWPHTYRILGLGSLEIVWMVDDAQGVMIPIQAKYYDFLHEKFSTGRWYGQTMLRPLLLRVKNKGLTDGLVAVLQPYDLAAVMEFPKPREDWNAKKV